MPLQAHGKGIRGHLYRLDNAVRPAGGDDNATGDLDDGFPVIVIAPNGKVTADNQEFIRTLHTREAEVIAISDNQDVLAKARMPIHLPVTVPEWLSPMTAIIPGQLFSMYLAHARDYDPDHPRGLRKVTETR